MIVAFPQSATDGTIAAYFLYGLESGLFAPDCAKDWAYSVVEHSDEPRLEIVEIASANRLPDVLEALRRAMHDADLHLAGRWLLGVLSEDLQNKRVGIRVAIQRAIQIAKCTHLPEDTYYELDRLDDALYLAESGTYGSIDEVVREAAATLNANSRSMKDA